MVGTEQMGAGTAMNHERSDGVMEWWSDGSWTVGGLQLHVQRLLPKRHGTEAVQNGSAAFLEGLAKRRKRRGPVK